MQSMHYDLLEVYVKQPSWGIATGVLSLLTTANVVKDGMWNGMEWNE